MLANNQPADYTIFDSGDARTYFVDAGGSDTITFFRERSDAGLILGIFVLSLLYLFSKRKPAMPARRKLRKTKKGKTKKAVFPKSSRT